MSVAATTWAWARPSDRGGVSGNDRLVLLAIADAADARGKNAWPTIETLAAMAGLSRRTVQRSIQSLEHLGILTVERQEGGEHRARPDRRPNRYTLLMDGVTNRHPVEKPEAVDNLGHGVTNRHPVESHGVSNEAPRGVKSGHHGVTELCHPNKYLEQELTLAPTKVDAGEVAPLRAVDIASLRTAILAVCGIEPDQVTSAAAAPIGKAARDLAAVGARPEDLPAAASNFRERFPSATLTPLALAKHWPQLVAARPAPGAGLADSELFGIALSRSIADRAEAQDAFEDRFDDPEDRAAAMSAWERARCQVASA